MNKINKRKYDADYIAYIESGESAAVFVARDIVGTIDTSGKWIDILKLEGSKNKYGQWDLKHFTIELFPRKNFPHYPNNATIDEKKYITWKTAIEDISEQRSSGYVGIKYMIRSKLVNRNKGKYREVKAAWNTTYQRWVPNEWFGFSCEWRTRKIYEDPEWDYEILDVKKL